MRDPKTPVRYTRARLKKRSLRGWEEEGTLTAAAASCGKSRRQVMFWFDLDPEYKAQVFQAIDRFAAKVGQEAHFALAQHVRDALAGKMVLTKKGTEGGRDVELYERVTLNPNLVRLLLTRADPRFTHPVQKHDVNVSLTAGERLAALAHSALEPVNVTPGASPHNALPPPAGDQASGHETLVLDTEAVPDTDGDTSPPAGGATVGSAPAQEFPARDDPPPPRSGDRPL